MPDWYLMVLLGSWGAAMYVFGLVRARRKERSSGLLYSYFLNIWTIHWLGALITLFPWFHQPDPTPTRIGFAQSTYGVLAFVFGSLVVAPALASLRAPAERRRVPRGPQPSLTKYYVAVGAAAYLLMLTPGGRLPTVGAVVSAAQQVLVVGLCLECWQAWHAPGGGKRLIGWLGASLVLPFVTIVYSGFLSYGAVATLVVFAFVGAFFRPRWKVAAVALVVAYVGLSFYVSYMRDRTHIREAVWGGKPLQARVEQVVETVSRLEWFDPFEPAHLRTIDIRLNQNYLIGVAIDRLRYVGKYAYGDTIIEALSAFIPRAIWADKPTSAGSGDLVSHYTGVRFMEGTSVGIGQVMEFYVNFGPTGVIVGFLVIGVLMTWLDQVARRCLVEDDWEGFALWYLVGISFLQVGGSLVDVAGTAGGSVVAVLLVNRLQRHLLAGRRLVVPAPETPSSVGSRSR